MSAHPALLHRPPSLCQLASDWRGTVDPHGTWAEPKMDGVRALRRRGELVTREGVVLHGIAHIARRLDRLERAFGEPMMFDGEFVVDGDYPATLRHVGRGARAEDSGTLWLFDAVPLTAWEGDGDDRPLVQRKTAIVDAWEAMLRDDERRALSWEWEAGSHGRPEPADAVAVMPDEWLEDAAAVRRRAAEIWAAGGEGLMLKDADAPYRRNRSAAWRKVKRTGWSVRTIARG